MEEYDHVKRTSLLLFGINYGHEKVLQYRPLFSTLLQCQNKVERMFVCIFELHLLIKLLHYNKGPADILLSSTKVDKNHEFLKKSVKVGTRYMEINFYGCKTR